MKVRLTWTDCDEAGDYVVPNVLCPRDLVSRPDNMEETVLHTRYIEDRFSQDMAQFYCNISLSLIQIRQLIADL